MKPAGFRFACPIRVRFSEVDVQEIVYYSRYLEYADVALTEYFRALGAPYPEMVARYGFDPSVVKATVEFKRPARFDEALLVHTRVAAIGRTSFRMDYEIVREAGGEQVVSAQIIYANFEKTTQGSRPVPDAVCRMIEAFEGTVFPASS